MTYKVVVEFNGKQITVEKTQEQVAELILIDGVKLLSLELASTEEKQKQWNRHDTKQFALIRKKNISVKQLAGVSGRTQRVIYSWLSKDDNEHYQKIADLVKRFEEGGEGS